MAFTTNAQLTGELATLSALLGDEYVPFPNTSDYFAYEVYERYRSEANQFLLGYASILIKTGRYFDVDETPKLREWIDAFEVAGTCHDVLLACTCGMTAYYLKQAIQGGTGSAIVSAATILSIVKETYRPLEEEMERLDYSGDYDAYLTQKMEEYKQWLN
ncbi:hypothetical protein [Lysinibacillus tabacifolii]|uniref:Uncharacterized protein n=1 Tax=Lysinibacillus tabacifolii TaxID=1173107 RepID=A0ABY2T3W0_9BACI|nr:hypothetical protein [Lysinibacillus tabacifolii]TKI50293.1 hypothetical protein FC748_03495 [Lysinibacillus tabacifolii]